MYHPSISSDHVRSIQAERNEHMDLQRLTGAAQQEERQRGLRFRWFRATVRTPVSAHD